jgi:hypothetical protein
LFGSAAAIVERGDGIGWSISKVGDVDGDGLDQLLLHRPGGLGYDYPDPPGVVTWSSRAMSHPVRRRWWAVHR